LKRNELDKHLNTDEAAVLGAAFYGASQSSSFSAKEFRIKDYYNFNTYVTFNFLDNGNVTLYIHL
jgi:molecular chaperone DnaK (HSP70)